MIHGSPVPVHPWMGHDSQKYLFPPALETRFDPRIRKLQLTPNVYTPHVSYAPGASETGIVSPSRNGCFARRGARRRLRFSPLEYPDPYFLIPETPAEPNTCLVYVTS